MTGKRSRYLGVQPFKTSDRRLFFGRESDIENLHDYILLEKVMVLFGKSGYGKSSLLSAGVVPRLTDPGQDPQFRYRPVEIRFGTYVAGRSFAPMETTRRFSKDLPLASEMQFLTKLGEPDTLWLHFKLRQTQENQQFVLFFDQFEEFFSYPTGEQEIFRRQLAELLYADIPKGIRAHMDEVSDDERRLITRPLNVKAVFAIRSDRMSLLDSMKDTLPAILHKRYELKSLNPNQAREAIVKPAALEGDEFLTPPFEYTEDGLNALISALTTSLTEGGKTTTASGIEAFQLQIVCEYIEGLVRDGKVPDRDGNGRADITAEELPEMARLYENYYRRKLAELSPELQRPAQLMLEDGLLAEDLVTGEGRRMSVDSRALVAQFRDIGLDDDLLEKLERTYLIRREINTVGGFSFEISHDTLVAPIQKAKASRKAHEEHDRLEAEQKLKEKQLAEARRQTRVERMRRRRANILSIVAVIGLAIAAWSYFVAYEAQKEAERERDAASLARSEANAKLLDALTEKKERLNLEKFQLQRAYRVYQKAGDTILMAETSLQLDERQRLLSETEQEIIQAQSVKTQ